MFDPEQFAQTSVNEANATEYVALPEGEYNAVIKDDDGIKFRVVDTKNGARQVMDVNLRVDAPPPVLEEMGRKEVFVRHQIWLDLTEDGTGLAMGKGLNVALGRLREAVGLNVPGQPFSFNMLKGKPLRIKTKHRKEAQGVFTDVVEVGKI